MASDQASAWPRNAWGTANEINDGHARELSIVSFPAADDYDDELNEEVLTELAMASMPFPFVPRVPKRNPVGRRPAEKVRLRRFTAIPRRVSHNYLHSMDQKASVVANTRSLLSHLRNEIDANGNRMDRPRAWELDNVPRAEDEISNFNGPDARELTDVTTGDSHPIE